MQAANAATSPRRNFYRLHLYDVGCQFSHGDQSEPGQLLDIGGGGARFTVARGDWSVRDRVTGTLTFSLDEADFAFPCRLIRKVDDGMRFEYVGAWYRPRQKDIDRLVQAMYRIELARPRGDGRADGGVSRSRAGASGGRLAVGVTAGLALGGAVFLLGRGQAVAIWVSLTCLAAALALLDR